MQIYYLTVVYSEIPFTKNLYHIETIQLICFANQLTGFYMIQGFTEGYFRIECTRQYITLRWCSTSTYLLFTCSFLIWKILCYDLPIEARKFTM